MYRRRAEFEQDKPRQAGGGELEAGGDPLHPGVSRLPGDHAPLQDIPVQERPQRLPEMFSQPCTVRVSSVPGTLQVLSLSHPAG